MPDRVTYRVAKFIGRHRVGVGVAAASTLVVLVAGGMAALQYLAAQEQVRQTAAVTRFLADVFAESEPSERTDLTGVSMKTIVEAGVERAERDFADRPALRGELLSELARLYRRHGENEAARATFERALATLESAPVGADHAGLNKARARLAEVVSSLGDYARAQALADAAIEGCRAPSKDCASVRGYAQLVRSGTQHAAGDMAASITAARAALAEYRQAHGERHSDTADAWESLAIALRNDGQLDEALASMTHAIEAAGSEPMRVSRRRRMQTIASVMMTDTGRYAEAIAQFEALQRSEPERGGADESPAQLRMLHAAALGHQGLGARALAQAESALALVAADGEADVRAWAWAQQARALSLLGRHDDALARIDAALAYFGQNTVQPSLLREAGRRQLGELLARAGRMDQAASVLRSNLETLQRLYPDGHLQVAQTQDLLGAVQRCRGDLEDARRWHRGARASIEAKLGPAHPAARRNVLYGALADLMANDGPLQRDAAVAAARALAECYPVDSHWHLNAQSALRRVRDGTPLRGECFADLIFAH
jgi:serine/threonine-protein kinase